MIEPQAVKEFRFNLRFPDKTYVVTQDELSRYAASVGLSRAAPDRFAWQFALDLYLYERLHGVEPMVIVEEIKRLECGSTGFGTKPASQFEREPLRSLWHKHFFSANFVAQNILLELANGKMEQVAREIFDPVKSPVVTEEMIREFSRRAVTDAIGQRDTDGRLTGEWIVFAKHAGINYYLCLATHGTDHETYNRLRLTCLPQFPFLSWDDKS